MITAVQKTNKKRRKGKCFIFIKIYSSFQSSSFNIFFDCTNSVINRVSLIKLTLAIDFLRHLNDAIHFCETPYDGCINVMFFLWPSAFSIFSIV